MQLLEEVITTSGGSYFEEAGEVKIKITSDELAKRFYNGMIKVCGIQSANDVFSPAVLELKQDFSGSTIIPTLDIITIDLSSLNSLLLDFERLSVTSVVSQGEVQGVDMTIVRLGDLSQDDIEFIKQSYTIQLEIQHTTQQADEDLLASILHHIFMLKEFHIRCLDERSLATIDLVISTRENIFQSGGSLALRTFKLMAEGETHIKRVSGKYHNSIEAMVTFDMKADIQLQRQHLVVNDDPVCEFTRRYGWSIKTLVLPWAFSDYLAIVLNESSDERGSQIVYLIVDPRSLAASGLEALGRTIKQSQPSSSTTFGTLVKEMAEFLVAHGGRLTSLLLRGLRVSFLSSHGQSSAKVSSPRYKSCLYKDVTNLTMLKVVFK